MQFITNYFQLKIAKSSLNQEIQAGLTTFLTMAYILVVNPAILSKTGMDSSSVFLATCLTSAFGCLLVGLLANYPVALAPGMAMNAYFAYQIMEQGLSWPDALGLIFISGILFLLICITPVKTWILDAIPASLSLAISSGIGIFIGFIALKQIGLISVSDSGFMQLGNLNSPSTIIALIGFISIVVMETYKIRGSIMIAIFIATTLDLIFFAQNNLPPTTSNTATMMSTFFALSFEHIYFDHTSVSIILTFLFVMLFDSTGTLIAVLKNKNNEHHTNNRKTAYALLANSITCITGSLFGTTPTSPYIESAAGIKAGGRTGLTAVTVALCFILAIIVFPIIKLVPIYATAPALLFVACLMIEHLADIEWHKLTEAIPAALTLMMIPFTFSIADGIGFGIISYSLLKLLCKSEDTKPAPIHPMMWILSIVFLTYFVTKYL